MVLLRINVLDRFAVTSAKLCNQGLKSVESYLSTNSSLTLSLKAVNSMRPVQCRAMDRGSSASCLFRMHSCVAQFHNLQSNHVRSGAALSAMQSKEQQHDLPAAPSACTPSQLQTVLHTSKTYKAKLRSLLCYSAGMPHCICSASPMNEGS